MEYKVLPTLWARSGETEAISASTAGSELYPGARIMGGQASYSQGSWTYLDAYQKAYLKSPWVYRCVDMIATHQSRIPIKTVDGYSSNAPDIEDRSLWRLLNVRPNKYQTAKVFRYALSAQLLLSPSGAFIRAVRGSTGDYQSLYLLPPHKVEILTDPHTFVSGYKVIDSNNQEQYFAPDDIIWVRTKQVHDTYSQITPIQSLMDTIRADDLATRFNNTFLAQGGRPGQIVGIKGNADPDTISELQGMLNAGMGTAGDILVIDNVDKLDVQGLSRSPTDIQFAELILMNKRTILSSFGVPETVMGNAGGNTADTADAEYEVFWTQTMQPHCDAIAEALEPLTESITDDAHLMFDYTQVDVLQRQVRNRHSEWLDKWRTGSCTFDEYRANTAQDTFDTPVSRMVFASNGVIIANPDDLLDTPNIPTLESLQTLQASAVAEDQAAALAESTSSTPTSSPGASPQNAGPDVTTAPVEGTQTPVEGSAGPSTATPVSKQTTEPTRLSIKPRPKDLSDAYLHERTEFESLVKGVLTSWDNRQKNVYLERMGHAKFRKGTRHWDGESGAKALNADYVVDTQRWVSEVVADLQESLRALIAKVATRAVKDLAQNGSPPNYSGKNAWEKAFGTKDAFEALQNSVFASIRITLSNSATGQSERVLRAISKMDADGASIEEIKTAIEDAMSDRSTWRNHLALTLATSAIEQIKYYTYAMNTGDVYKTWVIHPDEKVRPSHAEKSGETLPLDEPFNVGGYDMLFPGDMDRAPISQTAGCRCHLAYTLGTAA